MAVGFSIAMVVPTVHPALQFAIGKPPVTVTSFIDPFSNVLISSHRSQFNAFQSMTAHTHTHIYVPLCYQSYHFCGWVGHRFA